MSNGNQKILTNVKIFTFLIIISPRRSVTLYDAEQNREAFFDKLKGKFSVTEVIGKYPTHGYNLIRKCSTVGYRQLDKFAAYVWSGLELKEPLQGILKMLLFLLDS